MCRTWPWAFHAHAACQPAQMLNLWRIPAARFTREMEKQKNSDTLYVCRRGEFFHVALNFFAVDQSQSAAAGLARSPFLAPKNSQRKTENKREQPPTAFVFFFVWDFWRLGNKNLIKMKTHWRRGRQQEFFTPTWRNYNMQMREDYLTPVIYLLHKSVPCARSEMTAFLVALVTSIRVPV